MPILHPKPEFSSLSDLAPVAVPVDGIVLAGDMRIPQNAKGVVVFAHGSGSSRFSARNRYVAEVLNEHAVGTLLIDLLTPEEEQIDQQTRELRFNIPLLARRLERIGEWILAQSAWRNLKLGYFGASTGGAAALITAAARPDEVATVVSRGGRVDLAAKYFAQIKAPVLLIVGERDPQVLQWNKEALFELNDCSRLEIVPHATHLFEEPGALEDVAQLAADWFAEHFV